MKRTLLAIVAAFMMIASVNAQRLVDIQTEARFITDKMVMELGLSNVQRNNILNINLTYLDGIRSYRDIDSHGWKYRNKQLKHILSDKQWKKYKKSYYFYRPISWRDTLTYIIYMLSIQSTTGNQTSITTKATLDDHASHTNTTSTTRNITRNTRKPKESLATTRLRLSA